MLDVEVRVGFADDMSRGVYAPCTSVSAPERPEVFDTVAYRP